VTSEQTLTITRPAGAEALRGLCGGAVHLPGDPGYDAARSPWAIVVDQRPAAVACPATAEEVVEVVRAAVAAGLRVAPQGTGHNAGPLRDLDRAVLVRTGAMRDVAVDVEARTARVESGAIWEDVVDAVAPHGLAALHGSSPDVGVAGYSLGGGMGWYARELGLAANNITAIELVTADGRLVRRPPSRSPSCSGHSAAAAATSVWSPRSRSGCSRSRRCTPGCWSGTGRRPTGCCAPGRAGPPTHRTRSPRRSGCSSSRRSSRSPPRYAGGSSS
jgi:hypothetical protein